MKAFRDEIGAMLSSQVVAERVAPSASAGFAVFDGTRWNSETGAAGLVGNEDADEATVYDLASLTKPFVAASIARKVRVGALSFEAPLAALLPRLRGAAAAASPLDLLLSHRAGLEAHLPLYAPLEAGLPLDRLQALMRAANARRAECIGPAPAAGFAALYSDLGYLLSGEALAEATSCPLDEVVLDEVSRPLGIRAASARQWLRSDRDFLERVAPTEYVEFRGGLLQGVVHDENAWALSGHGLSGHAGLFGSVRDVLAFGAALLDGLHGRATHWLDASSVSYLVASRPNGGLRLGFDGKSPQNSSAGPSASLATFGHLGFTGTSFWCDPVADSVSVFLTNRVCPSRSNARIRGARPLIHERLFHWARQLGRSGGFPPKGLVE